MKKITSIPFVILFGIAAFGLAPSPAGAAVVYSYTGNTYTFSSDSTPPAGTYEPTMRVTGSFTVAAPLMPLLPSTDIGGPVTSYTFSDGRSTLDDGNSSVSNFIMSTDVAGLPLDWLIEVGSPFTFPVQVGDLFPRIITTSEPGFGSLVPFDQGVIEACVVRAIFGGLCLASSFDTAIRFDSPGTWTVTPAVVPLPPAVLLFGSALAALFGYGGYGMRRRRQV